MNLRPLSDELLCCCVKTPYCTNCKLRVGCGMRHSFYGKDFKTELSGEIFIQKLEIVAQGIFGEDEAFDAVSHIRNKISMEKHLNPIFSYM